MSIFLGAKNLLTYSRRSSKAGHVQKKQNQNTSQENLQKSVLHNRNSSIVKPAETGFRIKSLLGIYEKDGPMRKGRRRDQTRIIFTDGDQDKTNFSNSKTGKFTSWRRQRERKSSTPSNARQVSVSEQRERLSKGYKNIGTVENGDLHLEILSKSDMEKANNIDQRLSVKQNSSGMQIDSTTITINKSDLHCSSGCAPKILAMKGSLSSTSGARTSNSCSGLTAETSGVECPARDIALLTVQNPPSKAAVHFQSTRPVVSKEVGVAKRVVKNMVMEVQAAVLESTSITISPISEKEPLLAVERLGRVTSSLAYGTSTSQSFPALGVEWPDGPQFGLPLGSPDVAAQLVQSLDLLLQVDPLPTVEAMRSKLEECTRGYHAFGLPKDTWMAKLAALWDEFAHLHASQEQRQKTKMMIQQEEELLRRLRATQADVHARIEAARDRCWRAAFRAKELQSKVEALSRQARVAEVECSSAQAELETHQLKFCGLQGKVLLSETRIAELRKKGP